MNINTVENINRIAQEIYPERDYLPTTLTYIQLLIIPFAEAVDQAVDVNSLIQWIPLVFKGDLFRDVMEKLNIADGRLASIRAAVVESLIEEIIKAVEHENQTNGIEFHWVVPWDVKDAIAKDHELRALFQLNVEDNKLPITITVGPDQFTHNVSFEFAAGLLLYSNKEVGNHDFHITMFGQPFEYNMMGRRDIDERYSRFHLGESSDTRNYTVRIVGRDYTFDSLEFLQGFIAGAYWDNVDHHQYWSKLRDYTKVPGGTKMTF